MNALTEYLYQEELYHIPSKVIVVVPKPWHDILDDHKALLAKILGSVKVSIESVVIVHQQSVSLDALTVFNPGKVLIFGSRMDSDIPPYENVVLNDLRILRADDLGQLDDAKKKSLWLAIRQMFVV